MTAFINEYLYCRIVSYSYFRIIRYGSENGPRGYKTFFMLNSTEHEISLGHKNKNINN